MQYNVKNTAKNKTPKKGVGSNVDTNRSPFTFAPITELEGMPLYRQVKRVLIKLIESGQFAPSDCLPNESTISNALQVSIGTLRKAVDELVMENVLVRRQGRGTFVATHNQDRFLFQFFRLENRTDSVTQDHEYPTVENVSFEKSLATIEEAEALNLKPKDPVFRISNRLKLSNRAVVFDCLVISAQMFKGLTEKQFISRKSTIYNLYQQGFGVTVLHATERARAITPNQQACRVLDVKAEQPVLEVRRLALTFGDRPVEYRISTINTQYYDYVSELSKRN